ncbi:hypothetical protein [Sphingobacterium paucimobilis]|uniref:Carboxypeptidase-like regulatory domain-containing protein n=1 Tax=Sphingobacterium paucimobilis HER1398 TaxID=1346330 RepID=U2J0C8_9SPHI|nr:hypothetical protein [Sphingobacterium paucimobilis]ERJ58419.1 hypothetical protein M472_06535 [Sphingobacterium paucimobilis HER1398]
MIRFFIKIAILFPILFFVMQNGMAQMTELPKVSGLILEKSTGNRLADVNVINLKTNRKVTSNNFGVFYIDAMIGDTLAVTKVGYGAIKTVLYTLDDVVLEMQPGMQIETVVVARKTRQQEMEDILRDYEKKGIYNGGKNRVGTYLNSPATALYNLFGREAKNMKRFEKYMDREVNEIAVDRIFTKSIVSEHTDLEGEALSNFMEIYRPSYEVSKNWGQYDLLNYIAKSFKTWDEQGRPAPVKLPKLEIPPQN